MLENKIFDVLVCPKTKGALEYHKDLAELWSREAKLAYPIQDGLPIMVVDRARELSEDELKSVAPPKTD